MNKENCSACRFSLKIDTPKKGVIEIGKNVPDQSYLCRRYPPTAALHVTDQGGVQTVPFMPLMTDQGWCGEWAPVLNS